MIAHRWVLDIPQPLGVPCSYGRLCNGLTPGTSSIVTPGLQQAVRFLGAVLRIRVGGEASGGQLAVVEHEGERGYCAPLHKHDAREETFLVLDGELRVELAGQAHAAGAGAAAFLPRKVPHAFVVTSPQARFLTLHAPAGFERFVLAGGTLLSPVGTWASDEPAPDLDALIAMAGSYGIEILGPPPVP